jgi:hypothetical protein
MTRWPPASIGREPADPRTWSALVRSAVRTQESRFAPENSMAARIASANCGPQKIAFELADHRATPPPDGFVTQKDPPPMTPASAAAFIRRCKAEAYRVLAEFEEAEARRLEAEERQAAIVDALRLYEGTTHAKATALATDLASYSGNAWTRDRRAGGQPASATNRRRAWFRILVSRDGETIGWRRICDIEKVCSPERVTLQTPPADIRNHQLSE